MKRNMYHYKIILLVILVLLAGLNGVWAEEEKQITITEKSKGRLEYTYRVKEDIELRGVSGESKWYFDVDQEWEVINFKFNLFLRFTELIRGDISYITVYMNNIPVKSIELNHENNKLMGNWEIDIPSYFIKKGYNELKVRTHSRISEYSCADDKNIANWIVLDGKTNYVITYSRKFLYDKISDFPKPFIGKYEDESKGIGMMIPDQYSEDEITAALTLMAHMKRDKKGYRIKTTLFRDGEEEISDFDSIIYIGNFNSVPESLKSILKTDTRYESNDAHIYRGTLKNGNKSVLMIVSDNGQSLIKAVQALNNKDIKSQMTNTHISLPLNFDTRIKEEKEDDYIYFKELGLQGVEVKGINQQVTNVGISIPYNEILADESNINLKLSYSDNLDYEKSMVSIYINGKPIGSKKLEKDKRDLDELTAYIPKDLRENSYYDVRIIFELIPRGVIDCENYLSSVPWAYIKEDSSFFMPKRERSLMLLENLPYPFSRNDDIDITTIIVPDHPTKDDMKIAGKMAEMVGIGIKNNEGLVKIAKGSEFSEKHYGDNLIIFGTPEENKVIKNINKNLWFKYDDNYNTILSNEKIELLPQTSKNAAFIELKSSPYLDKKGMMTITSLNKQSIVDAIDYFEDDKRGLLTGDATIISKDGDLLTLRFQKEVKRPMIESSPLSNKSPREYLLFAGTILVFMLIGLILYLYKNRK